MKRIYIFLVGISFLLTGLILSIPLRANAMNNSSGSNTCDNSGFPAPYTGGADVAKFFHLSDGSTVTITVTGAVIKQGRCGNPYREGWINPSDICNIQSAQDLNGHLSSGSTNPNGSTGFTGCSNSSRASSSQRTPNTVTIINSNSQSQSQSQAQANAGTTASSSSSASNGTSSAQAQSQTPVQTVASSAVKTLPNTGPGSILMFSGATSAIGTLGHLYYTRRQRRH